MTDHGGSASLEIERKYEVIGDAPLPKIELPGAVSVVESRALLTARYWDTPELDLGRVGLALRSRSGGADAGWHVKARGEDGVHELHWPSADEIPTGALEALRERLGTNSREIDLAGMLAPVATVRSDRTTLRFLTSDGALLIEFADDRVLATDHRSRSLVNAREPGTGAGVERAWREWEAELGEGADPGLLAIADSFLQTAGAQPSLSEAKIQRTLGLTVVAAWKRQAPIHELLACALADLADRIAAVEPAVRRDEPGAIHHLRLLMRRARDLIDLFTPELGAPLAVRKATVRAMKRLSALLGAVHDAEVRALLVERSLRAEPLAPGTRRVRRLILDPEQKARAAAFTRLCEHIEPGSDEPLAPTAVAGMLRGLAYTAGSCVAGGTDSILPEGSCDSAEVIAARLDRCLGKIDARGEEITATLAAEGGVESCVQQLVDIRKKARRIRFAVEALGATNGAPPCRQLSASLARDARQVQLSLGHIRDMLAFADQLDEVAEASISHPTTGAAGELAARLAARARDETERAATDVISAMTLLRTHRLGA